MIPMPLIMLLRRRRARHAADYTYAPRRVMALRQRADMRDILPCLQ